jgi:FkbM family methyltransferase
MERKFTISEIRFLERSFLVESFINAWGEDDPITAQIHAGAFDEPQTLNFWCSLVANAPGNSLVIDVGSFTGLFSFVATALRPDIKSLAFEASTVTFGRLVSNILWNNLDRRVIPVNLAASDRYEDIRFPHAFGIYTMSPGEARSPRHPTDHTQPARCIPLDSVLQEDLPDYLNSKTISIRPFDNIAAIKIDVEGHELSVIEGASRLIERHRPVFICEYWFDADRTALKAAFARLDYLSLPMGAERNIAFICEEMFSRVGDDYRAWNERNGDTLVIRARRVLSFSARGV